MSKFKDIFSTFLPTVPAKIEPLIVEVDRSLWCVRANQGPPRIQSPVKQAFIVKQISEYLQQNVIRKSNAAYYSQIHMVPKPVVKSSITITNISMGSSSMLSINTSDDTSDDMITVK